jgi:hypothetical protein
VPTICLAKWPLEATMWDGDEIAGPVPTLFTEDVESATAAITKDVARAHQDLARISRVFFIPEHVNMAKAALLVKKPRLIMIQETSYFKISIVMENL